MALTNNSEDSATNNSEETETNNSEDYKEEDKESAEPTGEKGEKDPDAPEPEPDSDEANDPESSNEDADYKAKAFKKAVKNALKKMREDIEASKKYPEEKRELLERKAQRDYRWRVEEAGRRLYPPGTGGNYGMFPDHLGW